ncbi:MAG: ABC transporter permease [Actinobacteria bacterium]|nr:ABC transporter permease [Actinomycetota bacterium]
MTYAFRAYEYWLASYRRVWRGTIFSTILNPVLYLSALGVGLGTLVNRGHQLGVPYLHYVAPGILASTAMLIAAFESAWPVMGAIRWTRQFHAMLATPLRVRDVLLGHQLYALTRVGIASAIYLVVIAAFGAIHSWLAVFAFPAALLLGWSFSAPIAGLSGWLNREEGFNALFRFGVTPMFLFSGTFFPVSRLPQGIREIAYATPTWHGVDLLRGLTLGTASLLPSLGHVAYLAAWVGGGLWWARRTLTRRLVS